MDCTAFDRILERLVAESLSPEDRVRAGEHLAGCPHCRALLAAARGEVELPAKVREPLTQAILAATSGAPCPACETRLCAFVDGELGPAEAELVAHHLEHCRHCRSLAATLAQLAPQLAQLAELEPDDAFVHDVLARTTGRARRPWLPLALWWRRALHRPRFALEFAYCGSLLLLLATGIAGTNLGRIPDGRVTSDLVAALEQTPSPWVEVAGTAREVRASGEVVWSRVSTPATDEWRKAGSWVRGSWERVRRTLAAAGHGGEGIEAALAEGDLARAWIAGRELPQRVRDAWRGPAPGIPATEGAASTTTEP